MMKKFRIFIVLILVASMLLIPGCSEKTEENPGGNETYDSSPVQASLIHGSPTGLWFMLSSGIAESVNKVYPGSLVEISPGNNITNFLLANENSVDFGLVLSNTAYTGYNATGQFDEKHDNVGGISVFYPSTFQFLLRESLGIKSLEEIIENKIPVNLSVGAPQSTSQITLEYVLAEYGLTKDDMIDWGCRLYEKSLNGTSELFNDGAIDGVWYVSGAPTPAFVQLGTNEDLVLIELPEEIINVMVDKYGFWHYILKGGSYTFREEDYKSFCSFTMLLASLNVSEEDAYKVTRSINENLDYIGSIHSSLKGIDSERIVDGMPIPFHPGAEKYYREVGLIE
jgi:TRAP transporter TAXI family solute receptor